MIPAKSASQELTIAFENRPQEVIEHNIDYGWSHDYHSRNELISYQATSNPHATGLALLAMVYYELGESKQSFYPVDKL